MKTSIYTIPQKLLDELDNMESRNPYCRWTDEIDAIILKYWKVIRRAELSNWLIKHYGFGSKTTFYRRHKFLIDSGIKLPPIEDRSAQGKDER